MITFNHFNAFLGDRIVHDCANRSLSYHDKELGRLSPSCLSLEKYVPADCHSINRPFSARLTVEDQLAAQVVSSKESRTCLVLLVRLVLVTQ